MISPRVILVAMLVAAAGCGGGQTNASTGGGKRSGGSSGPAEPQLPSCDDGTCALCGDGVCPSGFYCETNKGVAGCAWLPSCVKNPSCDCLRSTLQKDSRCKCEDRKGVAFVTCSG